MPPKQAAKTPPAYDLRKKHIPRIPDPSTRRPGEKPAGDYVPCATARKIQEMRREAAASNDSPTARVTRRSSNAAAAAEATPQSSKVVKLKTKNGSNIQKGVHWGPFTDDEDDELALDFLPKPVPKAVPLPDEESSESIDNDEDEEEDIDIDTEVENEEDEEEEEEEEDNCTSEPDLPNPPSKYVNDKILIPTSEISIEGLAGKADEERAVQQLYQAKEKLKKIVSKRQLIDTWLTIQDAKNSDFILTSELEDFAEDIMKESDYPVTLFVQIYLNKEIKVHKQLADTTHRKLDLADIEEFIMTSVISLVGDKDFEITQRTARVKYSSGRGGTKDHDINDFSISQRDQITTMIDRGKRCHHSGLMQLTIEVKISCDSTKDGKRKKQHVKDIPSSPPVSDKKKTHTGKLQDQFKAHQDTIQVAGQFQLQLMEKTRCLSENCTNKDLFCYVDPINKTHYSITTAQHESWSNAIAKGQATVATPPIALYTYWKEEQGSVNRQSRRPK